MNKNCTKDDSEINELSEDEENAQEDIGSHQNLSDQSCDGAIAAQTVTSMPPMVTSFMRQYPVSALECTKGDPQAPPPVISNGHRTVPGELLASHEFPLPSIRTLEHGLKETLQSVRVDPPSLHPRPEAPATPLVLNLLRPGIIRVITGFVVLLFAWSNAQRKPFPGA
jgi:hypothetical protein